jgi:hypothetical protein
MNLILNSLWTSSKRDSRYSRKALVYYCIHIAAYIQGLYKVYNGAGVQGTVAVLEPAGNQGRRQPPPAPFLGNNSITRTCRSPIN